MPVTKSQLSRVLNLKIDGGNFIANCNSDAFRSQFISYELLPDRNTAIRTVEEVEKIFQYVLDVLKRIVEFYRRNGEQVKLQLKIKVSRLLAGNVESSTVLSEPMWSTASFIETGVHKLVVELKRHRESLNEVQLTYFPLQVLIMKLPQPIPLENMTPRAGTDESLINMSKRDKNAISFKNVGHKFLLDYVMFCSLDYKKIPYSNRKRPTKSAPQWCLYDNPSITFLIDGPTDDESVDTGGVHWLHSGDVTTKFTREINRLGAAIHRNLNQYPTYVTRVGRRYRNDICCICDKSIGIDQAHVHHCHRTGKIFGRAHATCNKNYARKQDLLPVFVYCQNADDFRGVLISLFHHRGLKFVLPKNDKNPKREGHIRLTLPDLPLVFINAHRFLPDSLQNFKALIPRDKFKRSNDSNSFPENPVPKAVETTLLLADIILFLREKIDKKFKLDLCRYHSLNEFILDSVLKKSGEDLILPKQVRGTIRPFPETLKAKHFQLSEFNGRSPIVRALKSSLPSSNFKPLPERKFSKFNSKYIAKLLNTRPKGYIFHITVGQENGNSYFVHYILLKYLIKNRNFSFTIIEILKFNQTPLMKPFLSEFSTRSQLDKTLAKFFCENIIENTNMVKPQRVNFKSVPVVEVADFWEQLQLEEFVTANCLAEDLIEVILSRKYNWYEFTFLSLALRDIILAFTYSSQKKKIQISNDGEFISM